MALHIARWRALRVDPNRIDIKGAEKDAYNFVDNFLKTSVIPRLQRYPPPRAGSRYVRRGMAGGLQGSWFSHVQRTSTAINGYLTNVATNPYSGRHYMVYVQGPPDKIPGQLQIHADTGWPTINDVRGQSQLFYTMGLRRIYAKHIRRQA